MGADDDIVIHEVDELDDDETKVEEEEDNVDARDDVEDVTEDDTSDNTVGDWRWAKVMLVREAGKVDSSNEIIEAERVSAGRHFSGSAGVSSVTWAGWAVIGPSWPLDMSTEPEVNVLSSFDSE